MYCLRGFRMSTSRAVGLWFAARSFVPNVAHRPATARGTHVPTGSRAPAQGAASDAVLSVRLLGKVQV